MAEVVEEADGDRDGVVDGADLALAAPMTLEEASDAIQDILQRYSAGRHFFSS